jgi:hypothetical protein
VLATVLRRENSLTEKPHHQKGLQDRRKMDVRIERGPPALPGGPGVRTLAHYTRQTAAQLPEAKTAAYGRINETHCIALPPRQRYEKEKKRIMGYFRILAAIPGFFLSSFFLMLLWGAISPDLGIPTITYVQSMLVTITLWLAVAPLAAVGSRKHG